MVDYTTTKPDGAGRLRAYAVVAQNLLAAARKVLRAHQHRRQVRQLLAFDDRMLRDIGLQRSDVEAALLRGIAHNAGQELMQVRRRRIGKSRPITSESLSRKDCRDNAER